MEFRKFELVSKYKPTGDQPEAINSLVEGINDGLIYENSVFKYSQFKCPL